MSARALGIATAVVIATVTSLTLSYRNRQARLAEEDAMHKGIAGDNLRTLKLMQAKCLELGQIYIDRPCIPKK